MQQLTNASTLMLITRLHFKLAYKINQLQISFLMNASTGREREAKIVLRQILARAVQSTNCMIGHDH